MTKLSDVFKWMTGPYAGESSKAIAMHMTSGWSNGYTPGDCSDFGRCMRLIKTFPEWKSRLHEMKIYKGWSPIIENWDKMEEICNRPASTDNDYQLKHEEFNQLIR